MSGRVSGAILLTGAAHGIGRATALALASRGYALGLIDRDAEALAGVVGEIGEREGALSFRVSDVTDLDAMREAVLGVESAVGPTGTLVACAGIGSLTLLPDLDPAALRAMLDVNVVGVANAIAAVLPGMIARGGGHVVGISSVAGVRGMPWMASYSASKAALTTYLEGLRPALKRRGVSVTTVYPGFVRTAMTEGTPFRRPVPMLEPEQAAAQLVRAIERRPRDLAFPMSAALGMGLLRRLPNRVYDRMMDRAGPRALTVDF
ncbi:SDR family NAD(P)-dependent oxidoreductase [Tautonia sociabilis]|uniref:SDR family NAD(P)-dependent oxidoreductase n=1 Tax=Tautonia sociabilis TaxID=2080755 RepID=A0A432MJ85_9BACT|nr:SDR family NAD(P)-dependent oxidoreductase [Tautonia sociabilis]RUL87433.1 SDR family NAD(P)-dependent oxidoreductase [Tautonia sociabilis]